MATNPIYIETEEEIPEVVERLRTSAAEEVPLVLPMRSRLGQSRFNFQILRQYGGRFGKRITIITPEPAVQQMAEESGLRALSAVDEIDGPPEPAPAGRLASAAAVVAGAASRVDAGSRVRVAMTAPDRLISKLASESHPGRFLLYTGAGLIAIVALLWTATFIPSANVTLVAEARPFSQEADLTADPGKAPIRVRVASIPTSSSQGFKATGVKDTPAALATGTVTYSNKCSTFDFKVLQGTRLINTNGIVFAQTSGDVAVNKGQSVDASVTAVNPGGSGNVGDHTINEFQGGSPNCLTVANKQPTGGGADEQKQPQITQSDYDAARAQLEQQLRQQIQQALAQQTQSGETLAALVNYDAPDVNTDHKVGETVGQFTMQMNLKGEGAFYVDTDVRKALQENLAKHVPSESVLTDNKVQTDYQLTEQDAGGHLRFHGKAQSFVAPKINYDQVRSRLTAKPTSQALSYLRTLPVQTAQIKQEPFALPLMPFLTSRIDIKYVVQQAPETKTS
jgi:Baseplate J-like protein